MAKVVGINRFCEYKIHKILQQKETAQYATNEEVYRNGPMYRKKASIDDYKVRLDTADVFSVLDVTNNSYYYELCRVFEDPSFYGYQSDDQGGLVVTERN